MTNPTQVTSVRRPILLAAVTVGALVLTVALLEGGLRTIHMIHHWRATGPESSLFHQASSIPGLSYDMAPNRHASLQSLPISTNQYGMRDDEPSSRQTESHCRIVVLGDSYTFGIKLHADQTYPKVL